MKLLHGYFVVLNLFMAMNGLWGSTAAFASEPLKVVVTIAPFHALVSAVTKGITKPTLLVRQGASPHHYTLRLSEVKAVQEANIIFWGGPELESFLVKPLKSINASPRIVQFDQVPNLSILPIRRSASFEAHRHDDHHHHTHAAATADNHIHIAATKDMHFWLDPNNAKILVAYIAKTLSEIDPNHRAHYQINAKQFIQQIETMDLRLKNKLKSAQNIPFIVFHDAYQYFEKHYGLTAIGSVNIHPEIPPGVERLLTIRTLIEKNKARCIFREPQFKPQIVNTLAEETHTKVGELDPVGVSSQIGGDGYIQLLEKLADSFVECLVL